MSKGGSKSTTNQSATTNQNTAQNVSGTSSTALDPTYANLLYGNAANAQSLLGSEYTPYTGALGTQAASLVGSAGSYTPQQVTSGSYTPSTYSASTIAPTSNVTAATIAPLASAGASTGSQYLQSYLNPYQSDVVNSTIAQGQQAKSLNDMADNAQAVAAGAFGGDRQAVLQGVTDSQNLLNTNNLLANLNLQGFNTAAQYGSADADRATNTSIANANNANSRSLAQAQLDQSASTTNAGAQNSTAQLLAQLQTAANAANAGAGNTASQFNLGQSQTAQQLNQAAGLQGASLGLQGGSILGSLNQNQFSQNLSLQQMINQSLGLVPQTGTTTTNGVTTGTQSGTSSGTGSTSGTTYSLDPIKALTSLGFGFG